MLTKIKNSITANKKLILISLVCGAALFFIYLINNSNNAITNIKDYQQYLTTNTTSLKNAETEMQFWQKKLDNNENDYLAKTKIANGLTKLFQLNGNVINLHKADSLLKVVNNVNKFSTSSTYRSLAVNCITQHQFKQAALYIDSALIMGDNKFSSLLLKADIELELGNIANAEGVLLALEKNNFEVLIRKAKIQDNKGNLDEAVKIMEMAFVLVKDGNNEELYCWALSNLGDMYGHQNEYKKSYESYLKVLEKQPTYYHCLKGIAWLSFAHDKNVINAKKILNFLKQNHPVPDYDLMLADVAAFEKNVKAENEFIANYKSKTQSSLYGDMYNKYNFDLLSSNKATANQALQIATIEVNNRPTPMSYSLLSWAEYQLGNKEKALAIAKKYVENKCFEPSAVSSMAIIYKANSENEKAKYFYDAVLESAYEIGPIKIENFTKNYKSL